MRSLLVLAVMALLAPQAQFRSSTDVVEVYATVKLKNGTIAHDLTGEDFELFEDGKRRDITVFSQSIQPLSVALVLDHSGSTESQFQNVQMAAQEFVGRLLKGDRASISTLSWSCQPFTSESRDLMAVLRMMFPPDWGSPIWAATDRAMSSLADESGRRIILLFSDGEDTQSYASALAVGVPPGAQPGAAAPRPSSFMSPCTPASIGRRSISDVVTRAGRDAVMVYAVSVEGGPGFINLGGAGDLARLAKQTGAGYQRLGDYSELKAAFRSIADELHLQYLLGFVPTAFDGREHKIEVRTKRSGVTVQARKTYVATVK